jgi:signal transduction histidine kinase
MADYLLHVFSLNREKITESSISYDRFFSILHYLQKMTGDINLCYRAGKHFAENRLLHGLRFSFFTFSVRQSYRKLDKILNDIFPVFSFSIVKIGSRKMKLTVKSSGEHPEPDYFFIEFIRGIISAVPGQWDLPDARTEVRSYSFSAGEFLDDLDILYQEGECAIFNYERKIADEVRKSRYFPGAGDTENIHVISNDLYARYAYLRKGILLNADLVEIDISWRNIRFFAGALYSLLMLLGVPLFGFLHYLKIYPLPLLVSNFLLYEVIMLLLLNSHRRKGLADLYRKIEANLQGELGLLREVSGEALSDTGSRVRAIENLMEISKCIIHSDNIADLFSDIRHLTARALDADRATVFLHDRENRELRSGPEYSEEAQEFKIPEDKGIAGEIFKLRKIVNIKDAYNNPNFNKSVDRETGYETRNMLGAPLIDMNDRLVGIIQVLNKKDGHFEKIDEQILESLSAFIAAALKNTMNMRKLELRGIDPDIVTGLSSIIGHIYSEYSEIKEVLYQSGQEVILPVADKLRDITRLLETLVILFDEEYKSEEIDLTIEDFNNRFRMFLAEHAGEKDIDYSFESTIPIEHEFTLQIDVLDRAALAVLKNSIEAIDKSGRIGVRIFYSVEVPNALQHKYSLQGIIYGYNKYSEENSSGFIQYVKSRKPMMDPDLDELREAMKEFMAVEIFDDGHSLEEKNRGRLFHPFFSTKNHFGLGLAVSKNVIRRTGGEIEEPREVENGKVVKILVPLVYDIDRDE